VQIDGADPIYLLLSQGLWQRRLEAGELFHPATLEGHKV
jgi:hypothetical protein